MPLKIAVYSIAKNEEKHALRYAKACKGADGIFVLDTGSTDRTVEILRAEGVHVKTEIISPWRFDVARNKAMELVPNDYDVLIVVDLDDVLADGWREMIEKEWKPGTTRLYFMYAWSMKNETEPEFTYRWNNIHSRIGYKWISPIHEAIVPVDGFKEIFGSVDKLLLMHFPDPSKSRGQYLHLLEIGVDEDPSNPRTSFYYGRELWFHKNYDQAITQLKRYLSINSDWGMERAAACRIISDCIALTGGSSSERLKWLLRGVSEEPNFREPWMSLCKFYHEHGDFFGAYFSSKKALEIKNRQMNYLNEEDCWNERPYDLCALSAYKIGMKSEAALMGRAACEINRNDQRLIDNLSFYERD